MAGVLFATPDLTTNLAAWYKINDGSGTNVADSSGHSNTATLTIGSGAWTGSAPAGGAYSTGLTFNASSIAVPTGVSVNPSTTSFTISALVYGTSFGTWPLIVGCAVAAAYILMGQNVGNYAGINGYVGASITPAQTQDLTTFSTSTWTHVAITWDGTNINVYVDGSLADGPRTGSGIYSAAYNTFLIGSGAPAGNSDWAGYIQNVRFYVGRVLDAGTIAYLSSIKG